jgi:hypothetical protein
MILTDAEIKPVVNALQIQVGVRLRHAYDMCMTKPLESLLGGYVGVVLSRDIDFEKGFVTGAHA